MFITIQAQAQTGWNWPEDPQKREIAKEKNVLYEDSRKQGNFRAAVAPLHWLLVNVPNLNSSIYINGAKIYEALEKIEKDPARKKVLQDSALVMYDLRIEHFNKEGYVLNRKAGKAYQYYKNRKEKYQELMDLFKKVFELNGNNVLDNNTIAYFDIVRRYKLGGNDISDDAILEIYDQITGVIDYKAKQGKNVKRLETYKSTIDNILAEIVEIDCEFIENNLGPKLDENPDDLNMAKKIVSLALSGKCLDLPSAMKAAKIAHEKEPSYGFAVLIAKKTAKEGDCNEAIKYFKEAAELTEDNAKKAENYMDIGSCYRKMGSKSNARDYFKRAVQADPNKRGAYTAIGDMYFASNECMKKVSRVDDRAIYIAAYKMYKLAGNTKRMASAKEQFPSAEDIFTESRDEGETLTVGCWINETVTLQKR
ncbi:tetratricopeptide repeat protein [Splendidivirga corallicola]